MMLAVLSALVTLFSCSSQTLNRAPGGDDLNPVSPGNASGIEVMRDTSGAPTGIRVYWWRDNSDDTVGYYLYRDTSPITGPNPALRVNNGNLIAQPPSTQTAIIFNDYFQAGYGNTYYYRATTVDLDNEESAMSFERSVTIQQFSIASFSPRQGTTGSYVYISGSYFGAYDELVDAVYFTGVSDDKLITALVPALVKAEVISWGNDSITVRVPKGATVGPIQLVCNNIPSFTAQVYTCTSPYILSITPDPATAGESISINGANFGSPDGTNLLLINDIPYGGLFRVWSDTLAGCTLPSDLQPGIVKIELQIGGYVTNYYGLTIEPITP